MPEPDSLAHEAEDVAIVLVAHGAAGGAQVGRSARLLAARLRGRPGVAGVDVAFLHGEPALAAALDVARATARVCVVPLLAADGHHTRNLVATAIAAALAKRRWQRIVQAPPLGIVPAYAASLAARLRRLVARAGIDAARAAFLAIGHGSRSRTAPVDDAAARLAALLRDDFATSAALYLDGDPPATSWPLHAEHGELVVAPVFFSDAHHAGVDAPRLFDRAAATPRADDLLEGPSRCRGRRLWYAQLPPSAETVADIVAAAAREAFPVSDQAPRRKPVAAWSGA